jgi:di/tricarboxylate transporter
MLKLIEVLVIFVVSTVLLISNRVRYDIIGIGTVVVLVVLGIVTPTIAMAEFASIPVFILALVMILSRTISGSGIMEKLGEMLTRRFKNEYLVLAILFLSIGLLSGFMSDVALTLMMIPIAYVIAEKLKHSPTKYLMPFAFIAVLGGRFTVASTSSNLVLYGLWYQRFGSYLPFFTFSMPGLIIVIAAIPLVILITRLLPDRVKPITSLEEFKTGEYLTEASLEEGSEILGKTVGEIEASYNVRIVGVYPGRIGKKNRVLRKGDVIIIRVRPETIATLSGIKGVNIAPSQFFDQESKLTEVFIMPDSKLVGTTISNMVSASRYNIAILGISAYGKRIFGRLRTLTVQSGDVLLVSGHEVDIAEFMSRESLAPLHQRDIKILNVRSGAIALGSLAIAVGLASAGVNIILAYLIAVIILLATKVLDVKDIYHSIEWPIIIFIGTYIVFGDALVSAGITGYISDFTAGSILILFLMSLFFANLIGNVASAVIMGPVAFLFPDPLKAVVVVAMAASCTFITPWGNQSNLLVMSPGGYTVKDYALYGTMLVILAFIITYLYAIL